jgi:DNA-binding transcriptional MerR regulator
VEKTKMAESSEAAKAPWKFTDWYKVNGGELNDSRRNRYSTDPAYREQVLEANRESRRKRRQAQLAERAIERETKQVKTGKLWKETVIDGQTYLTIGALASALGRSKLGIRLLERSGVIPTTPHRNAQKERLYTPAQVVEIQASMAAQNRLVRKKTAGVPEAVQCRVKLSDGTIVLCPLFRVGVLAKSVGRSPITLEQMERRGAIPATPLRLRPNRRVFTAEQIEAVKAAFDKRGGDLRADPSKGALKKEILAAWKALKITGARVLEVLPVDKKPSK